MEPVGSDLAVLLHNPQLRQGLALRDERPRRARPRIGLSKRLSGAFFEPAAYPSALVADSYPVRGGELNTMSQAEFTWMESIPSPASF